MYTLFLAVAVLGDEIVAEGYVTALLGRIVLGIVICTQLCLDFLYLLLAYLAAAVAACRRNAYVSIPT